MKLEGKRLTSVAKGAKYVGVEPHNLYHRMNRGELTRYRVGNLTRVDLNELDALVTIEPKAGEVA